MANLKNGSRGDDVRQLQQALIDKGYNVGSTGADGIYGANTQAAVWKYQQDNGLTVDGIAGTETLGHMYSVAAPQQSGTVPQAETTTQPPQQQTAAPKLTAQDYATKYAYDPQQDEAYISALQALQNASKNAPTAPTTFDQQLLDVYNQIVNRKPFEYDVNEDALYKQYRDKYIANGQLAMRDTMAQAAGLTGGYGSSYAQGVGQQAYDRTLQGLNDIVPELYDRARAAYSEQGAELKDQFSMIGALRDDEYGRYQDDLTRYYRDVDMARDDVNNAYSRGASNWYNALEMGANAEKQDYARQQDAYTNLINLITKTGYSPSAEELTAAGMSEAQAKAYKAYYDDQKAQAASASSGSGGSRSYSGGSASSSSTSSGAVGSSLMQIATGNTRFDDIGVKVSDSVFENMRTHLNMFRGKEGKMEYIYDAVMEGKITDAQADQLLEQGGISDAEFMSYINSTLNSAVNKANARNSR